MALKTKRLQQFSFYGYLGQKIKVTDPRTGANLFDDHMRKKRTVGLSVFE